MQPTPHPQDTIAQADWEALLRHMPGLATMLEAMLWHAQSEPSHCPLCQETKAARVARQATADTPQEAVARTFDPARDLGRPALATALARGDWGETAGRIAAEMADQLPDALVDSFHNALDHAYDHGHRRGAGFEQDQWEAVKKHFPGLVPALDLVYCHVHGDEIATMCQAHEGPPAYERNGCTWRPWPPDKAPPPA
jgi:hypothetical protein